MLLNCEIHSVNGKTGTIFCCFFTTLRRRRVLHLSPTCHADPWCPSYTIHVWVCMCMCIYVCVCMYICVYVYVYIYTCRVWVLLCHACVTQTCAPLLLPLYSIRPQQLSTIQPSVLLSPSKSRSSVLLTIQI